MDIYMYMCMSAYLNLSFYIHDYLMYLKYHENTFKMYIYNTFNNIHINIHGMEYSLIPLRKGAGAPPLFFFQKAMVVHNNWSRTHQNLVKWVKIVLSRLKTTCFNTFLVGQDQTSWSKCSELPLLASSKSHPCHKFTSYLFNLNL